MSGCREYVDELDTVLEWSLDKQTICWYVRLPGRIKRKINPAEPKIWLIFGLAECCCEQKFTAKIFSWNAAINEMTLFIHPMASGCQGLLSNVCSLHEHCNPQNRTVLQNISNSVPWNAMLSRRFRPDTARFLTYCVSSLGDSGSVFCGG